MHYLSFHTQVLEDLMFPDAKLRKNVEVVDAIKRVAKEVLTVISGSELDALMDEWKLFALDSDIGEILS